MTGALAGVILSGGRSRRMGQDKAQLRFRDASRIYTMQSWMNQRWSARLSPLLWVGKGPGCIADRAPFQGQGPIAGIHAGLGALIERGVGPFAMLLAVDMPAFAPAWVDALVAGIDEHCQAVMFEGSSLLGALVRVEGAFAGAEQLLHKQERRLGELVRLLAPKIQPAPAGAELDALRSAMNRPEDFRQWLAQRGFEAVD